MSPDTQLIYDIYSDEFSSPYDEQEFENLLKTDSEFVQEVFDKVANTSQEGLDAINRLLNSSSGGGQEGNITYTDEEVVENPEAKPKDNFVPKTLEDGSVDYDYYDQLPMMDLEKYNYTEWLKNHPEADPSKQSDLNKLETVQDINNALAFPEVDNQVGTILQYDYDRFEEERAEEEAAQLAEGEVKFADKETSDIEEVFSEEMFTSYAAGTTGGFFGPKDIGAEGFRLAFEENLPENFTVYTAQSIKGGASGTYKEGTPNEVKRTASQIGGNDNFLFIGIKDDQGKETLHQVKSFDSREDNRQDPKQAQKDFLNFVTPYLSEETVQRLKEDDQDTEKKVEKLFKDALGPDDKLPKGITKDDLTAGKLVVGGKVVFDNTAGVLGISYEEKVKLKEEVDNISFEQKTESYEGETRTVTYLVQPYEKELKRALDQIKLQDQRGGVNREEPLTIKSKEVQDLAKQNILIKKENKVRENKVEAYIQGDVKDALPTSLIRKYQNKDLKSSQFKAEKANYLTTVARNDVDNFQKNGFRNNELLQKFKNDPTLVYNIAPGEQAVKLEDGRLIPAALYNNALKEHSIFQSKVDTFKESNELFFKSNQKLQNADEQWDLLKRNYNDGYKFTSQLGQAAADILINVGYGIGKIAENFSWQGRALNLALDNMGIEDPLDSVMNAWNGYKEDTAELYKKDQEFGEIETLADVGEYALQSVASQLPIILAMVATGGTSAVAGRAAGLTGKALTNLTRVSTSTLVGMSSFGGKVGDMTYEEFKTGKDLYSDSEMLVKGFLYGVVEGGLAAVSTANFITKGIGNVKGFNVTKAVTDKAGVEGRKQFIKNFLTKELTSETVIEMGAEGLTTGLQNLIDGRPFMENMAETLFTAGIWGAGMSGFTGVQAFGARNFAGAKQRGIIVDSNKDISKYQSKINELTNQKVRGVLASDVDYEAEVTRYQDLIEVAKNNRTEAINQVEVNLKKKGIREGRYVNSFVSAQLQSAKLRQQAADVIKNVEKGLILKTEADKQLNQLDNSYRNIQGYMDLFTSTDTFADGFYALGAQAMGSSPFSKARLEFNKIKAEAVVNIRNKKKDSNYNPTKQEIDKEGSNIVKNQEIDSQIEKDRKISKKLKLGFKDVKNSNLANLYINKEYNKLIDQAKNNNGKIKVGESTFTVDQLQTEKENIINGFKSGEVNGINSKALQTSIVVRDNMYKNNMTRTGLHETTHGIVDKLIQKSPNSFNKLVNQIDNYLKYTNQQSVLAKMQADNAGLLNSDGSYNIKEFIASFMENVADGKIDLEAMDNQIAVLGKLFNNGLNTSSDNAFDIAFNGEQEILQYFVSLGKAFKSGVNPALLVSKLESITERDAAVERFNQPDQQTDNRAVASKTKADNKSLYQRINTIYDSDESLNERALKIGRAFENDIKSRLTKGYSLGGQFLQPSTWSGWDQEIQRDVISDAALGGSGVAGLVKAYSKRDMSRFGDMSLEVWINDKLNQRITGYLPKDLVRNELSIDEDAARQIEDAQAGKFDEAVTDTKTDDGPREIIPVEELTIVTPELVDEVKDIITRTLKRTALTKGVSNETVLSDLNTAIEKEITKVIKNKMGPITRNVLGFAPKQYTDFIKDQMMTIVGSMPTNVIKQKAKSKAWAEIFKLTEIGREDIKKVNPDTGKVTNYRKQIFKLEKPDPQKFQRYFTRGGYTTLIERQKSLTRPMAQQLARSELARLRQDSNFIQDLAQRTGMTDVQVTEVFVDSVIQDIQAELDNTASEVLQQDTISFSKTLAEASSQDKQTFISGLKSDGFKSMLGQMLSNSEYFNKQGNTSALREAIITYFTGVKFDDLTPAKIKTIANDFGALQRPTFQRQISAEMKKFKTFDVADIVSEAFARRVEQQQDYSIIEADLNIFDVDFDKSDINSINQGRAMALKLAIKIGREKFIKLFYLGLTGPDGLAGLEVQGTPRSLKLTKSDVTGVASRPRTGLFKNKADIFDNVINAKDGNGNFLVGTSKGEIGNVTSLGYMNSKIYEKKWFTKNKEWEKLDGNREAQLEYVNKIAEDGNVNKKIYRETINSLAEDANKLKKLEKDFNSGKISKEEFNKQRENLIILTPTEARWMVSVDSGSMYGALKASASLIGFPDLNKEQLQKSLNLDPNDKYVLEHMTPAKYMALLTYKYLLDPSAKNKSDFNTELDNFNTIILPDGVDTILRESGKQSSMGLQHKIGNSPFETRYDEVLKIMKLVLTDGKVIGNTTTNFSKMNNSTATKNANVKLVDSSGVMSASRTQNNGITVIESEVLDKALSISRDPNAPVKKIRVFDFDDTLAQSKSKVFYEMTDGTKGELTAEQFAERGGELLGEGAIFDFSDFNIVRDGKPGPLLDVAKAIQKARGTEDVFVLTARAPESAQAIQSFLKSIGLDIPLENITGLGNSSEIAKSSWIVNKAAEGYNDFYFADDAPQNVRAVKNALDLMDVKSKTQLAKDNSVSFSKTSSKKLDWKTDEAGNIKTTFEIDGKKYNFNLDARDGRGSFDVEFNLGGRIDITGTGDSVKVVRTVYNGLLDLISENDKINKIEFSARKGEKSRVRLYTTLMDSLGKKLGWETDVWDVKSILDEDGGYFDFELVKPSPVSKALDVVDIKSPTQQAKASFSRTVDQAMNDIIYEKTGIESFKEFSDVRAQAEGRSKRSFDLIPPSAEDFGGLLYRMLGKGKVGDAQWEWMQENLIRPYNRGVNDLTIAQNTLAADFKALKQSLTGIPKDLKKKAFGGFTFEDIVRIHTWNKQGVNVEGISKRDLKQVSDFIAENPELDVFSNQLIAITKQDGYYYPGPNWLAGTITTDFREGLRTTSRSRFLAQWQANIDEAFSPKNLNKIEAAFGAKYREALQNSLERMKSGSNRSSKMGRLEAQFLDYINGSVGAVMFLNARSAVLQTISSLNFVNWGDNNVLAAGRAFANQPQYWKDFMTLMNSDYLVDRRNGLKINVSENEIAEAAKTSKNKAKAVISTLLSKGFVLTQFADSFAIASGGATFYRNRIKRLMKDGMTEAEATKKAFEDFKAVAEESQQSADPSKISMQQASTIGKLVLAWGNTPMQYNRIMKKATLDLVNGRGDWKDSVSKIVYYGALQNIIFTTLQSALFAVAFSDDEEESDVLQEKGLKTANSLIDNILRGMGIGGAIVSTIKNLGVEIYDRSKRKKPDYADVALKLLDVAPPVDVKVSKFRQGLTTYEYSQKDPRREEFFNIDNPSYSAAAKVIAATTNVPVDRLLQKAQNLKGALDDEQEWWKRVAMFLGWPEWQLRSTKEANEFKEIQKERRKQYKDSKKRQYAYKKPMTQEDLDKQERAQDSIAYFKLRKPEQVAKLDSLGLTKKQIRALRYEKDRVAKLLELME